MSTEEELRSQINSTQDLQSVVKTMKALAAVSIRQYQKAVESLTEYYRTIEMGLHIVMRQRYFAGDINLPSIVSEAKPPAEGLLALVFGSDQGLCGQFNQQIAVYTQNYLAELGVAPDKVVAIAIGLRVIPPLENADYEIVDNFSVPRSASEITPQVQQILLTLEAWREQKRINRVMLFFNEPLGSASYQSRVQQLLPLSPDWLRQLQRQPWQTSVVPTFTMDWRLLFSCLVREYLFISIYRAFAASLASENASRLAAMQSAEKNIDERLGDLQGQYRRQRQSAITAELLDVVAGFEALSE